MPATLTSSGDTTGFRHYPELPPGGWTVAAGLRTWNVRAGTGTPVVFVYGGNFGSPESASGAFAWAPAFERLAGAHHVVAYDKPGQGYTENPRRAEDYTMAAVVDHLIDFLAGLGVGPVHLVGHSRGGYVVTRAALLRQDLVRSVTMVNSGTLSPGVGTNEVILARPPFPPSPQSVRWVYEQYMHDRRAVTDLFVETSWGIIDTPKYQDSLAEVARGRLLSGQFLPQLARDKRETLTWLAEGRLQRPVQIIWGRDDRTATVSRGVALFKSVARHERRTTFSVVDKCGHFPFREHSDWFADTVRSFLEEVDRGW